MNQLNCGDYKKLMNFSFKPITFEDWEVLLNWRNEPHVRRNSHNSEIIAEKHHKPYIKSLIESKVKNQYIFSVNDKAVGTIRQDTLNEESYELSYIISPEEQGKKLGELMIRLFLYEKKGEFLCEIKKDNTASIKAAERSGFKLCDSKGELFYYSLNK